MSPKNIYYERCAQTIISNLQKRRMEGYYYPTAKEAVEKALSFLTPGLQRLQRRFHDASGYRYDGRLKGQGRYYFYRPGIRQKS